MFTSGGGGGGEGKGGVRQSFYFRLTDDSLVYLNSHGMDYEAYQMLAFMAKNFLKVIDGAYGP